MISCYTPLVVKRQQRLTVLPDGELWRFYVDVESDCGTVEYIIEFHYFNSCLVIPRICPSNWLKRRWCFTRSILREEGRHVRVPQLLYTVMYLYDKYFWNCESTCMIVSGNYNSDDDKNTQSRKAHLYRTLFIRSRFVERYIEYPILTNSFIVVHRNSGLTREGVALMSAVFASFSNYSFCRKKIDRISRKLE